MDRSELIKIFNIKMDIEKRKQEVAIKERDLAIEKRDIVIEKRDIAIKERDIAIKKCDIAIKERDLAIEKRDIAIEKRDTAIKERDIAIEKRDIAIKECDLMKIEDKQLLKYIKTTLTSHHDVSIQLNPPITYPFLITCFDGGCYYGVALTFFKQFNNDDGTCSESSFATAIISLNCLIEKL
ncbi:unnamed protein product [Rotaria sp. Silwood1]|nr:unnamed protein product [Rotaria sp. Silwood1]